MLDPKLFRQSLEETAQRLKIRGFELDVGLIRDLEQRRKLLQVEVQQLQNERNLHAKEVGSAKNRGLEITELRRQVAGLSEKLAEREQALKGVLEQLQTIYSAVPNLPQSSVPSGLSEENNQEVRRWGEVRRFSFTPKSHEELGMNLEMMDFASATKITGARFVVLATGLAKLQRMLIQFMLDIHTREHGYQELYVPHLVNAESLFGTGQLPKFQKEQFNLAGDYKYTLISTAEIPVTNLVRDRILTAEQLPLKYVAHTPCYRSEAGSYGKDLSGMIRQHQFEKVELVRIERPEHSDVAHEELTHHAEVILQRLGLPYRVVALCGGDLGFSSAKTYDLEVWLPHQNRYREISSCSNFEAFQARRMQARYRTAQGEVELLHTLNGSGLAVGRTLIAILENYQEADGSIRIPEALQPYMDGQLSLARD